MREIEQLKEEILREYPRLEKNSSFTFSCHPGVDCYNNCCGDVNIFLTPYDIIRLKNRLGMSSEQFLSQHTIIPFDKDIKYPVILLGMNDDEKKSCPFVAEQGCTVYEDRPWACRMYPLGLASPKEGSPDLDEEFYFLLQEDVCKGFNEDKKQTVAEWLDNQGINEYTEMGTYFKNLTLHKTFQEGENLTPDRIEMFFLACYNLDKFREFIFESTFFEKFDVDEDTRKKIKEDDVELYKFGNDWLRFALFGEDKLKVNPDAIEAKKKSLGKFGKHIQKPKE